MASLLRHPHTDTLRTLYTHTSISFVMALLLPNSVLHICLCAGRMEGAQRAALAGSHEHTRHEAVPFMLTGPTLDEAEV